MLQKRSELVFNVIKKDGIPGILNLGLRFFEEKKRPEEIHFFPTSMQVELTTSCNLRCTMCEQSHLVQNPVSMKFDEFRQLLDSAPFVELVNFTGIGEILLNPDWFRILEYAKRKGLYVWFNDNFTLMNRENAEKIIGMGIDAVAVSFDGATKKTYESIRRGAKFETTTSNIRQLIELRNEKGKKKPEVFMVFVAMKENYFEMPELVALAKKLGLERVLFVGVITFDGTEEKSLEGIGRKELEKVFEKTKKKAEELGVTVMGMPSLSSGFEECTYPWVSGYVTSSSEVLPCCFVKQRSKSEVNSASMGSAKETSFREIWKGKKYRVLRKMFRAGNYPDFCNDCYKMKNKQKKK